MTTVNATYARNNFFDLIKEVAINSEEIGIIKDGKPVVVMMSPEVVASLHATIEILSDKHLLNTVRSGDKDIQRGDFKRAEEIFD